MVKLAVVKLVASIGFEKVALGLIPVLTPLAPSAGFVLVTGPAVEAMVVKLHVTALASATPSEAFTPVVSVAT
jgi:hypothetical protein